VAARAIVAGLVKQSLPDIFPDGVRPIVFDRDRFLDFDNAKAGKHSTRNTWRGISERRHCWIGNRGFPAARGSAKIAAHHSSGSGSRAASRASFSICSGDGIRQLAGRSFVIGGLEQRGTISLSLKFGLNRSLLCATGQKRTAPAGTQGWGRPAPEANRRKGIRCNKKNCVESVSSKQVPNFLLHERTWLP
jgi:hypothetical protein